MNRRCVWIAALAGLCLAWYGTARAVTITAEAGAYVATADPNTVEDRQTGTDDVWAFAENWVCEGPQQVCALDEYAYGAAWGTADGNIRVGAGHYLDSYGGTEFGPADGSGSASVTWYDDAWLVSTNDPSFTFTVNQGWLGVGGDTPGSGTLTAWYLIEVYVGNTLAWSSQATLEAQYDSTSGWTWKYDDLFDSLNGTVTAYNSGDFIDIWVDFEEETLSIDLTQYAGSTVPITYYMAVGASDPAEVGGYNWSEARFGDPFPQPVPEPGTLILVGSGLAGLAGARRRRRRAAG